MAKTVPAPHVAEDGVVNTGSWKKKPCKDYSYVEIEDGQVVPKTFS